MPDSIKRRRRWQDLSPTELNRRALNGHGMDDVLSEDEQRLVDLENQVRTLADKVDRQERWLQKLLAASSRNSRPPSQQRERFRGVDVDSAGN
jgi:hypothetical protein